MVAKKLFPPVVLITLLLFACQTAKIPQSPSDVQGATSLDPPVRPESSKSAMVGQIATISSGGKQPLQGMVVRLATVHWSEDKTEGAFVLDGASAPSAKTVEDGVFIFTDIEPGDYVIVVGDVMGLHEIISEPDGAAKIYSTAKGQVLDAGLLEVSLEG